MKGSQKHLLDLVASPDRERHLNGLLDGTGFRVGHSLQPYGRDSMDARSENAIETFLSRHSVTYAGDPADELSPQWWKPYGGKGPTIDLLALLAGGERAGLLVVEAKAHHGEMKQGDKKRPPKPQPKRIANDLSIRLRLCEQSCVLSRLGFGEFTLSADRHYQLSNRLAYASKLAECGLDVVLMYLGFTHSDIDRKKAFESGEEWDALVRQHLDDIGSATILGERLDIGRGTLQVLVRSLDPLGLGASEGGQHG